MNSLLIQGKAFIPYLYVVYAVPGKVIQFLKHIFQRPIPDFVVSVEGVDITVIAMIRAIQGSIKHSVGTAFIHIVKAMPVMSTIKILMQSIPGHSREPLEWLPDYPRIVYRYRV